MYDWIVNQVAVIGSSKILGVGKLFSRNLVLTIYLKILVSLVLKPWFVFLSVPESKIIYLLVSVTDFKTSVLVSCLIAISQ